MPAKSKPAQVNVPPMEVTNSAASTLNAPCRNTERFAMLSRLPVGARNRPVPNCTGRPSPLRRRFSSRSKGSKRPIQLLRLSAAHPAHTDVPFFASSA